MLSHSVLHLSHQPWAFLNLNLTGEEKKTFNAVPMDTMHGNGLEVWRQVVGPLVSRTEERRHELFN